MEEDVAENASLVAVPIRRRARDDDALRIDHLAHDAAAAVRRRHEHRADADLFRAYFLQGTEEDVGCRVAAGERDAQPAEQRAKERVELARLRERETERGVGAGVFRHVAQSEHGGDGDERVAHPPERRGVHTRQFPRAVAHVKPAQQRGGENPRARGGEPVQLEHGFLGLGGLPRCRSGHHGICSGDEGVQPGDVEGGRGNRVHGLLAGRDAPEKNEHAQENPRHPGFANERGIVALDLRCRIRRDGVSGFPIVLGLPDFQQHHQRAHGTDRGDDVHQPGAVIIRDEELRHGKGHARR